MDGFYGLGKSHLKFHSPLLLFCHPFHHRNLKSPLSVYPSLIKLAAL